MGNDCIRKYTFYSYQCGRMKQQQQKNGTFFLHNWRVSLHKGKTETKTYFIFIAFSMNNSHTMCPFTLHFISTNQHCLVMVTVYIVISYFNSFFFPIPFYLWCDAYFITFFMFFQCRFKIQVTYIVAGNSPSFLLLSQRLMIEFIHCVSTNSFVFTIVVTLVFYLFNFFFHFMVFSSDFVYPNKLAKVNTNKINWCARRHCVVFTAHMRMAKSNMRMVVYEP